MSFLNTVLAFVVAISILVTIHELGHYWAARFFGVKILRFSIGFGRPLWSRRIGPDQTEWVVALMPLGGFVRMADARDESISAEEALRGFSAQPMWARMLIILAGPAANFVLAAALYWGLFVHGTPGTRPFVATPVANSPAAVADFREWDLIRSIDGTEVVTWNDARMAILDAATARTKVEVSVSRLSGAVRALSLDLSTMEPGDFDGDFLARVGLRAYRPPIEPVIGRVLPGSVAESAGLVPGDRVMAIDEFVVSTWEQLVAKVVASPGKAVKLSIARAGAVDGNDRLELRLTPETIKQAGRTFGRIGVEPKLDRSVYERLAVTVRHGPIDSVGLAVQKVWESSAFSLKMMWRMLTGNISWKNLSGPITIADYAGQSASLGVIPFVTFLALISVSLGVLNLLPIPLLDGGQLMYHIAEWIKGSPVSDRAMEIGQQVGLMLLLCLTAFAFFNDIQRLVSG